MDDMRKLVEEFVGELRELVQPAPKLRRAAKLVALALGFVLAGIVAAIGWELKKAPDFGRLDAPNTE